MPTVADVAALRSAQEGIQSLVESELASFVDSLDLSRPERSRDQLLRFAPVVVTEYGVVAADMAADWYDEIRAAERVPGRFRATPVAPVDLVAVEQTVRRAAGHLWSGDPTAVVPSLQGPLGRYSLSGARDTVRRSTMADPRARGWQRVHRADACGFCRMLADRGGVYTRETAAFASHNHCNCGAAPSWDPNAREVSVEAYRISERAGRMTESDLQRLRDYMAREGYAD